PPPLPAGEVHLVGHTQEPFEPPLRQVLLLSHPPHDGGEAFEVVSLDDEGMALEERNDVTLQGWKSVDRVRPDAAVRPFRAESPTAEHADHRFEHCSIPLALLDVEDGREFPPACRARVGGPLYS